MIAAATVGLLVLASAPAGAAEDPLTELTGTLQQTVNDLLAPAAPAPPAPTGGNGALTPVQDDDPDKEMTDPVSPDHASSDNATVELAENDLAGIGQTDATIGDDDSASADASALSLGGNEIIGAHSEGNQSASAGDPLEPVCSGSDGALCAQLVEADATSSEANGAQSSQSSTNVVGACVGGDDATGETCSGPVAAGVLTSDSAIQRGRDGHTQASSSSSVADVCLVQAGGEAPLPLPLPEAPGGGCLVGAEAVESSGASSSRDNSASKDSTIVALEVAGQPIEVIGGEPMAIEILPDCPEGMQLACLFLNQGETYIGSAGHAITALDANLLNGTVLATVSHTETLVHKFPAAPELPAGPGGPGEDGGVEGGPAGGEAADSDGVLPDTGGLFSGLLTLALLGLALGAFLVAWSRRAALTGSSSAGAAWADGTV